MMDVETQQDDSRIPHEEMVSPPAPSVPWYRRPVWLGLVGLMLLVGGWRLSVYVPEGTSGRAAADLERMTDDEELRQRLRRFGQPAVPPYQLPGRLLFFAGLMLFGTAAVRMARAPVPGQER